MIKEYEISLPHSLCPIPFSCQEPININDLIIIGGCTYKVTKKSFKLQNGKANALLSVVEIEEGE